MFNAIDQVQKKSTLTEKYQFVNTKELVSKFVERDFTITKQVETKVNKLENKGFQKHFIEFSHPKLEELRQNLQIDSVPRILLTNSHNGTTGVQLKLALFRLICSNGLVVSTGNFGGVNLRHSKTVLDKVPLAIDSLIGRAFEIGERVQSLSALDVRALDAMTFAKAALELRLGAEVVNTMCPEALEIAMNLALNTRRQGDFGNSAWNVFNRVQETIIRGGIGFSNGSNKFIRIRQIKSAQSDLELNQGLWKIAEETIFTGKAA